MYKAKQNNGDIRDIPISVHIIIQIENSVERGRGGDGDGLQYDDWNDDVCCFCCLFLGNNFMLLYDVYYGIIIRLRGVLNE